MPSAESRHSGICVVYSSLKGVISARPRRWDLTNYCPINGGRGGNPRTAAVSENPTPREVFYGFPGIP